MTQSTESNWLKSGYEAALTVVEDYVDEAATQSPGNHGTRVYFTGLPLHMVASHLQVLSVATGLVNDTSDRLTQILPHARRFDLRCSGSVSLHEGRVYTSISEIEADLLSPRDFILAMSLIQPLAYNFHSPLDADTFESLDRMLAFDAQRMWLSANWS